MSDAQNYAYLVDRQRRELKLADEARTPQAKKIHLDLAAEYDTRARDLNPDHRIEGAAFKADETDPANIDQIRNAGPASIRDRNPERSWDEVDESSDESFPASDPPGAR